LNLTAERLSLTAVNLGLTRVRFHSTGVRLNLTAERLRLTVVNLDLTRVRFYSTGVRLNLTGANLDRGHPAPAGDRGGSPVRSGGERSRAAGRRGDPAAGSPHPSEPDQEVAGARLPRGDESREKEILEAYSAFVAAFREAAEKLKAGDRMARFPLGSFPPGLPFVGAYTAQPP
jgi:hypothetical protein